jgi:hypothetical protein
VRALSTRIGGQKRDASGTIDPRLWERGPGSGSMLRRMRGLPFLPFLLLGAGCAVTRAVAPLERGQGALTASLGGPMFDYGGIPMPAPLASLGYRRGLTDRTGVHGALHVAPLALLGIGGLALGVNTELLSADGARPRLMVDGTLFAFAGDNVSGGVEGGLRVFPDLGLVAAWDLGPRPHHLYAGIQTFVQPFPDLFVYPYPVAGGVLTTGRVGWQLELGWPAITSSNLPNFVDWLGPFHQGAVSVQLGAQVKLGRTDR